MCSGCGNIKRYNKGGIREGRKKKGFEAGDINAECTNRNAKNSAHQVRVGRGAGKFPKARQDLSERAILRPLCKLLT